MHIKLFLVVTVLGTQYWKITRNRENNNTGNRTGNEIIATGEAETLIGKKIMSFGDKVIK